MEFEIQRASYSLSKEGKNPLKGNKKIYSKKVQRWNDSSEKRTAWYMEINTLQELMELYKQEGALIISGGIYFMYNQDHPTITIYDDYVE